MTFQHLHVHNEYSVLDGFGTAKDYTERAATMGFTHLALTNHGNIAGAIKWQKACIAAGIKPIHGCEMYVVPDITQTPQKERRGHITFLARNLAGWTELCRVITIAHLEGHHYKPRIDYNIIANMNLEDIVILTGCAGSFLQLPGAEDLFMELYMRGETIYLEIMPHNIDSQKEQHKRVAELYAKCNGDVPLVATNDCHYIQRMDWAAQETLLAVQTKAKWNDPNRFSFGFKGLHLRNEQEMLKAFQRQESWTDNEVQDAFLSTEFIAEMCGDFLIPKQEISLPELSELPNKKLEAECLSGMGWRNVPDELDYWDRYVSELDLITEKGFAPYFLICQDLVQYAHSKDIMVGPGRGSVGGCLIAYLLGITELDPIEHGLSFSRFLSAERNDWPDIDLDFEKRRRPEVIEYIETKYGKNNTCGITTDSKMKGRAVLNDVCKVFEVPTEDVLSVTREIDVKLKTGSVAACMENTQAGRRFFAMYKDEAKMAIKLEGQLRQHGLHGGAVVVSADDLTDGSRCTLKRQNDRIVCCWDMEDAEYSGLMKLDILGLSTLDVLSYLKELINKLQVDFNYSKIPFDDAAVYDSIHAGDTAGLFQINKKPTTNLAMEMQIKAFGDIVALVALVRPGPTDSGMTEQYIKRQQGGTYGATNPIYDEVTADTFGLLVYQEQVMQVISRVAGLTESTADKIRKVIGKKRDSKEFAQYREQFLAGCIEMQTFTPEQAATFWVGLEKWASYGFNLAHSVGYGILAYWTGWCKVNYPAEFMAATLTYDEKEDKQRLVNEAMAKGLRFEYPKASHSDPLRWIIKDDTLFAPLAAIDGIGEAEALKAAGQGTSKPKVQGFFDIKPTVKKTTKTGKLLKDAGAFDLEWQPLSPEAAVALFEFYFGAVPEGTTPTPRQPVQQQTRTRRMLPEESTRTPRDKPIRTRRTTRTPRSKPIRTRRS